MTRFFETGDNGCILSAENVAVGSENCEAFRKLRENASIDAQFEMQTFLHEHEQEVSELATIIKQDFLRHVHYEATVSSASPAKKARES